MENTEVISEKDEENNKEDAHAVALNVVLGVVQLKMRMEMNRKIEENRTLSIEV
jgi:anti-sigma-K factor RskA